MMLSDGTIMHCISMGTIGIDPYVKANVQPASVDLRLANTFRVQTNDYSQGYIDPLKQQATSLVPFTNLYLAPGEVILASTVESVRLPSAIAARVEGKSSLGRLGLMIHATAGFIDPGFSGQVTLELSNAAKLPIRLRPNMKICQISFMFLDKPAENPYGSAGLNSKYQGQSGPTESRYDRNGPIP